MKMNSAQWSLKHGVVVTDPDGWDRPNFDASWAEEITEAEFTERVRKSTSLHMPGSDISGLANASDAEVAAIMENLNTKFFMKIVPVGQSNAKSK